MKKHKKWTHKDSSQNIFKKGFNCLNYSIKDYASSSHILFTTTSKTVFCTFSHFMTGSIYVNGCLQATNIGKALPMALCWNNRGLQQGEKSKILAEKETKLVNLVRFTA